MLEFYKFKLINTLNEKYLESCSTTLDVSDFVKDRHLNKVRNYLFKEYKRKMITIFFEYLKFKKDWKQYFKNPTKKNKKSLLKKYHLTDDEIPGNNNNHLSNDNTQVSQVTEDNFINDERSELDIIEPKDVKLENKEEIKQQNNNELEPL